MQGHGELCKVVQVCVCCDNNSYFLSLFREILYFGKKKIKTFSGLSRKILSFVISVISHFGFQGKFWFGL